ncbi:hypothetical protein ABRZ24_02595 [Brenneria populi]|uniref:Uncharacterized protein n=1 Tax=Brenneria populi TaxID=1505588 RepID=A0ABU6JLF2_9GAMM|nr:hypothetical protein [Brenneria populi Li et al. 2015]
MPPGLDDAPNAAYFPAECPRVKSEDIAELHWKLHTERNNGEAVIGDIDRLYSIPGFR